MATDPGALPFGMRPGKVVAVHLSYRSRAAQRGRTPVTPSYFLKPSTSLSASGTPVERPVGTELLAYEGEIALVIGRDARRVGVGDAWSYVGGVTAANDLGVYDLRHADKGSNLRAKGGDGFTPVGPEVLAADRLDPGALRVRTWVNGDLVQEDDTGGLLFSLAQIVADLSQLLTLEAGDVVLTGTPAGSSVVEPGDVVEVEVDAPTDPGSPSTGRLRTPIEAGEHVLAPYGAQPHVDDRQRIEAWGDASAAGLPEPWVLTEAIRKVLVSVSTATLSSQLRKRGIDNASVDGVAGTKPGRRMVGSARTLRFLPNREDLFAAHGVGFNAQKRAFDDLGSGDVLVIDARGQRGTGTVGDILALRAQVRGAAGIVTDGGVRDVAAVGALDIPTFHAGAHPAVLGRRHVPWDVDIAIACGGTTVRPGDVVVGDDDGVVVLPAELADEVAYAAAEQEREEEFIATQIADGADIDGLYPMGATWRAQYESNEPAQDEEGGR